VISSDELPQRRLYVVEPLIFRENVRSDGPIRPHRIKINITIMPTIGGFVAVAARRT